MKFIFDPCNQYIEARITTLDTLIELSNFHGENVRLLCFEKTIDRALSPQPIWVPILNQDLVAWTILPVEYGKSLLEEVLHCQFRKYKRQWNCAEELIIEQCVWENPQSIVMRGSLSTDDNCPQCDQRNTHGEISCRWAILDNGLYLKEYSPNQRASFYFQKQSWIDGDPERKNLALNEHLYKIEIRNDIDSVVRITCPKFMNRPINLRARSSRVGAPVWYKRLDILENMNWFDTWTCDFLVVATNKHRNSVNIWTPPGEVPPILQDPPCIDCAWKLTDDSILLDMRDCTHNTHVWQHAHHWV